jgi:hypothetical protein
MRIITVTILVLSVVAMFAGNALIPSETGIYLAFGGLIVAFLLSLIITLWITHTTHEPLAWLILIPVAVVVVLIIIHIGNMSLLAVSSP